MQNQFDQWYQNLHARNGMIGASSTHGSAYSDNSGMASTQPGGGAGVNDSLSGYGSINASMSTVAADYAGSKEVAPTMQKSDSKTSSQQQYSHRADDKATSGLTAQEYAAGMHVADSKGDDVNEDLAAFYQAREAILKRKNGSGRN